MGERYNRGLFWAKAKALASALRSEILPLPARRRCLDAGIGHGWLLERWRREGIGVIAGLDIAPQVAERARSLVPSASIRVADLAVWEPEPGESYDLVSALDVLFYLREDTAFEHALAALARAVAPGGLLVVADNFAPGIRDYRSNRSRPWASYAQVLRTAGLAPRRRRAFFVLANRHPGPDGTDPFHLRMMWNLARARNPLARPLEAAAVLALYGLDALILSQGGRWGSQEISVWRKPG